MSDIKLMDDAETVPIEDVKPHPNNPKKHPEDQVKRIAASISEYDWDVPIVVDEDLVIIKGHGRLKAAKKLNLDEVPVIIRDDLNKAEAKGSRIADNKTTEGDYDDKLLAATLKELDEEDADLETGMSDEEIDDILAEVEEDQQVEDPEAGGEKKTNEDAVTSRGEVWILGQHRLKIGDATDKEDVKDLMDGEKADMVFTDPPYGIDYQSNHREDQFEKLEGDEDVPDEPLMHVDYATAEDFAVYVWTRWDVYPAWFDKVADLAEPKNLIVWKKASGMGDLEGSYQPNHELCIYATSGRKLLRGTRDTSVWDISGDNAAEYQHPTQKPTDLAHRAIQNTCKADDTVLDLYAGSGSTLLAAEQLDRKSYHMELEPVYADVIIQRYKQLSGLDAKRQSDGDMFSDINGSDTRGGDE